MFCILKLSQSYFLPSESVRWIFYEGSRNYLVASLPVELFNGSHHDYSNWKGCIFHLLSCRCLYKIRTWKEVKSFMVVLEQEPRCTYVVHTLQRCPHASQQLWSIPVHVRPCGARANLALVEAKAGGWYPSGFKASQTSQQLNEHPSSEFFPLFIRPTFSSGQSSIIHIPVRTLSICVHIH